MGQDPEYIDGIKVKRKGNGNGGVSYREDFIVLFNY